MLNGVYTEIPGFIAEVPPAARAQVPPPETFLSGLGQLNPQALVGTEGMQRLLTELTSKGIPKDLAQSLVAIITDAMKPALFSGIQEAFLIATFLLGLGLITTCFLTEIPLRKSNHAPAMAMAEGGAEGLGTIAEEEGREMAASGFLATELPADEEPELVPR